MKNEKIIYSIIVIAIISIGLYLYFKPSGLPAGVEYGQVNAQGECTSRSGVELVVCCGVWNEKQKGLDWVPCEDLKVNKPSEQAMVSIGTNYYDNLDALMFGVKVENSGSTIPIEAYVDRIVTINTIGGDINAITEINNAWTQLTGISKKKTIGKGSFEVWGMNAVNPIRLSTPGFTLKDGTYESTVYVKGYDTLKPTEIKEESFKITYQIIQRTIGFTVNILPPVTQ